MHALQVSTIGLTFTHDDNTTNLTQHVQFPLCYKLIYKDNPFKSVQKSHEQHASDVTQ